MRFLFTIHYPMFGGPHNQALRLDDELRSRGWETIVALPDEDGNAEERLVAGGVEVRRLPLHRIRAKLDPRLHWRFLTGFITGVRALRRTIRDENIDLVVIGGLVNPHAAIAARLERVPVVWQLLDSRAPAIAVRVLMPLVTRLSGSVMTTGRAVAELHPGLERLGPRVFPFFPPVDTESFSPNEQLRLTARKELRLPAEVPVVGSVSNINPQKGQVNFARAATAVLRSVPDARFVLFGATYPQHAEYLAEIKRTAVDGGLTLGENFIIHDPGSEVAKHCSAVDVFALTSVPRSEGIPTVVEEAMSLAKPVVTFNVGSVSEAVVDGETGFVIDSQDPEALAAAILDLLRDRALRKRFASASRRRAESTFSLQACADVHIAAFEAAQRSSAQSD